MKFAALNIYENRSVQKVLLSVSVRCFENSSYCSRQNVSRWFFANKKLGIRLETSKFGDVT